MSRWKGRERKNYVGKERSIGTYIINVDEKYYRKKRTRWEKCKNYRKTIQTDEIGESRVVELGRKNRV